MRIPNDQFYIGLRVRYVHCRGRGGSIWHGRVGTVENFNGHSLEVIYDGFARAYTSLDSETESFEFLSPEEEAADADRRAREAWADKYM